MIVVGPCVGGCLVPVPGLVKDMLQREDEQFAVATLRVKVIWARQADMPLGHGSISLFDVQRRASDPDLEFTLIGHSTKHRCGYELRIEDVDHLEDEIESRFNSMRNRIFEFWYHQGASAPNSDDRFVLIHDEFGLGPSDHWVEKVMQFVCTLMNIDCD